MMQSTFFLVFHGNVIQEEPTYFLGQAIMKPNNMQTYSSENYNICVFRYQNGRQIIPHQKVAGIPRTQPALKLFVKEILIHYCCS
jgi:hypothetical protein